MTGYIREVAAEATRLFSNAEIEAALDKIAREMKEQIGHSSPILLCVLIGGIVPLGNLLTRLDFPLEVDYIHVSRYGDKTKGSSELKWEAKPAGNLQGRTVVIVDDILDEGLTLAATIDYCRSCGAKEVFTAVLIDKERKRSELGLKKADFTGLKVENRFIFGYGLDYKGYLRNVPGIYVVAPKHE